MRIVPFNTKTQRSPGSYHLTEKGDMIIVSLKGNITGQLIHALSEEILKSADAIHRRHGHPVVLMDMAALRFSDITSSARAEGRRMLANAPIGNWALFGSAHVGMLAVYVARAAGVGQKMRYFSDRRAAVAWLRGETSSKPPRSSVGLIVSITIGLIGIVSLVGWQIDNPYLTKILPSLRPINPLAAAGLVALGTAFFCYWRGALRPLRILGWVGIGLGIAALLPLDIDMLLYADAVRAAGSHTQLADSAAICFILSGLLGLLANREGRWVQPAEYTLAGIMAIIAAFNIYGQLYAHDFIYNISDSFVMALNLALAFLVAAIGMIILVLLRRTRSALQRISRSGWLIVIALVFVQVATYGSWAQAQARNADESTHAFSVKATDINEQVNTRLQAYVSALHGFRGLFAASTNVSQGDFEAYYSSLNLTQTYPGLRSIAFISAVKTGDLPAFATERKNDASLVPGGHPQFKIQNPSKEPLHFIVTYIAGTPVSSSFGSDVTSIPGRSTIYNNALKSNGYYSSGTITFPASASQPAAKGFFIATPVNTADKAGPIGVVSANFNYHDFFGAILKTIDDKDLVLSVRDSATKEVIYASKRALTGSNFLSTKIDISLAQNQSWQVEVQAPANFGATTNQTRLAGAILFFGQLFTMLLIGIFILQIRARGQALALADAVTEDLQAERDNIAALHIKDEAMLAGIGEGLIAVDKHGKIEVVNAAAMHMLGYDEGEMVGQNVFSLLRAIDEKGELIPDSKRPIEIALKKSKTVTARLGYLRKDYRQFPAKVTVAPIILRGELIGAIELFSDITREKQLEHMKDEFLSVASHELRTPMGAIRANLSMILEGDYGPVSKDLAEPLTDMRNSTIRLVELVSDLLNVARIEAGRMRFALADFNIIETARSVANDLAPLGKEKGVRIVSEPAKGHNVVQGDPDKVKQVLTNLIGNSLKFTDAGSITVSITSQKDMVEVNVTDTGIGITQEDQSKLFGKFNQITSAQAGKPAGTGLGLYISREIVRKMGGEMWIKSSMPGKGSTFAFTLPHPDSQKAKKAKQAIDQEAKLHPDQV